MNVKACRAERLHDTLELCDKTGNVVKTLDIELDIDIISREIIKRYNSFLDLSQKLREAQREHDRLGFDQTAALYTLAVDELFSIAFGDNNRLEIYEFYENNYIEMVEKLMPYIFGRVIPAAGDSVKRRKNDLKKAFKKRL